MSLLVFTNFLQNLKKVFAGIVGVIAAMASYSLVMKAAGAISLMQSRQELGTIAARLAGETSIAAAKAGGAAASVTAGSAYLGPGALAVGAAAFAALMGYIGYSTTMGAMGGGGASSDSDK